MSVRIIDASVAIKWFVPSEKESARALSILKEIERNPKLFAVPELFFNEMLSVFCKLTNNELDIKGYLRDLQDLGFYRIGNGYELLTTAVEIAVQFKLSGYDAIYAACAKLMKGIWITADNKTHSRIASLKISESLKFVS